MDGTDSDPSIDPNSHLHKEIEKLFSDNEECDPHPLYLYAFKKKLKNYGVSSRAAEAAFTAVQQIIVSLDSLSDQNSTSLFDSGFKMNVLSRKGNRFERILYTQLFYSDVGLSRLANWVPFTSSNILEYLTPVFIHLIREGCSITNDDRELLLLSAQKIIKMVFTYECKYRSEELEELSLTRVKDNPNIIPRSKLLNSEFDLQIVQTIKEIGFSSEEVTDLYIASMQLTHLLSNGAVIKNNGSIYNGDFQTIFNTIDQFPYSEIIDRRIKALYRINLPVYVFDCTTNIFGDDFSTSFDPLQGNTNETRILILKPGFFKSCFRLYNPKTSHNFALVTNVWEQFSDFDFRADKWVPLSQSSMQVVFKNVLSTLVGKPIDVNKAFRLIRILLMSEAFKQGLFKE